jgi:hypothetical protein
MEIEYFNNQVVNMRINEKFYIVEDEIASIIKQLQQENQKYKEVIDKLQDKFNFYKNTDWGLKSCEILKVFEDILKEVE